MQEDKVQRSLIAGGTERLYVGRYWRRWSGRLVATGLAGLLVGDGASYVQAQRGAETIAQVYGGFRVPPPEARPMVRWWWFGAAVEKPEILREMQQMKADGIGGAELAFVYPVVVDDPKRGLENLPFLSPAMLEEVRYAQAEGRKLGLRMDVTLCSGWPYGGPATTLAEAAERLRTIEVAVRPGQTMVRVPELKDGESLISVSVVRGAPGGWDATTARSLQVMAGEGHMEVAEYPRTVLFFVEGHTRQKVKRAAVGAEGYVLDPFNAAAVATHLRAVGEPLVRAFGDAPPYAVFSDSLEAYGADWTPNLPAEFLRRRGYDLLPHLPELLAGGSVAADTVRHDYGMTLTELVNGSYLTQINDWALAHHTRFRSQTYGTPAVSFSSQRLVGLAEGEGPQWREFSTLRWATSANHVFGGNVTSGESFTWLHSPVFRATPLDMKTEADIDFIMGENQFIFHGWPYSAPQVSEPGWSLYAAAALNDHNPWHPVMPYVAEYIARLSYLMRQGKPANQVAVLLPTDDAWAKFSPGKVSITDGMTRLIPPTLTAAILSAGYNFDFIDADAIDSGGVGHPVLVLPAMDRIPAPTLEKIARFAAEGGRVVAVGRIPSMSPEGKPLSIPAVCAGAAKGPGAGACHPLFDPAQRTFVPDAAGLRDALKQALAPDFELVNAEGVTRSEIGFIRRTLPVGDIYFVVNTGNRTVDVTATFGTKYAAGEEWNLDSADVTRASAKEQQIHLAPYESRLFVFSDARTSVRGARAPERQKKLADLSEDWKVRFVGLQRSVNETKLMDWTADSSTLHYSGEAIYTRAFSLTASSLKRPVFLKIGGGVATAGDARMLPEEDVANTHQVPNQAVTLPGPGMRAAYDPPIREAALVSVNGRSVGALWHPPYILDVYGFVKPGGNRIEIRVYNTALNAWSALPPHHYSSVIARYGDRFQMQDMDKVRPVPSGLLGSVELVTAELR